uniref:CD28 molecule n=1 Tax=Fundulus heteroclitus TaxID=8078 RepID=A0A3Q2QI03_FUNHE
MFLTHCTMGWMLTLTQCVFPFFLPAVKVMQPYRVVSTNGAAQIHCVIHPRASFTQSHLDQNLENPFFNAEDVRVTLLRGLHGSQKVCSSTLNISEQQETQWEKDGDVRCAVQIKGGTVEVALSGLKATHTDIYRCGIQILYPPPYQQLTGNGTLLHVLGRSPQYKHYLLTVCISPSALFTLFLHPQKAHTVLFRSLRDYTWTL